MILIFFNLIEWFVIKIVSMIVKKNFVFTSRFEWRIHCSMTKKINSVIRSIFSCFTFFNISFKILKFDVLQFLMISICLRENWFFVKILRTFFFARSLFLCVSIGFFVALNRFINFWQFMFFSFHAALSSFIFLISSFAKIVIVLMLRSRFTRIFTYRVNFFDVISFLMRLIFLWVFFIAASQSERLNDNSWNIKSTDRSTIC